MKNRTCPSFNLLNLVQNLISASGGQGALFEKTAPWTPTKAFIKGCFNHYLFNEKVTGKINLKKYP
jgi:hypothetical protein